MRRRRSPRLEVVGETVDEPADVRVVLEELNLWEDMGREHGYEASAERERRVVVRGLIARLMAEERNTDHCPANSACLLRFVAVGA